MYLVIHGAKLQIFLNGADRLFKDKITKITDYAAESNYLRGQHSRLLDFYSIENEKSYKIAVEDLLIEPSWANVVFYWKYIKEMSQELLTYIAHFSSELSAQSFPFIWFKPIVD